MPQIDLKRIISGRETASLIAEFIDGLGIPLNIRDAQGNLLLCSERQGEDLDEPRYPVRLLGEVIGWVGGDKKASLIASLLSHLSLMEFEKKTLARETLDKYKEITILYNIAENISACLDLKEVARLILDEAKRLVRAAAGSIMLMNEKTKELEIISALGQEYEPKTILKSGRGIAGSVILSGKAEIVNDVSSDPRFIPGKNIVSSLMCAPLKIKDRVLGVINISSETPVTYTAGELKFLSILASEAAAAIENAILHENKLKEERIKTTLERYIAPQIVKAIMEAKEDIPLIPAKKNIAILFSDIRNFSSVCEELAPEKVVGYLNEYFAHMVDIIFRYEGTLNKFVGDMIVAIFGAPSNPGDNERRAIETAINMQRRIKEIPVFWIRDNFNTGIGINSGEVVVGNIGSPQHMDYTAIGDEVNIAERLQSIAGGGQILVTSRVYDVTKGMFKFREFGSIEVKGKRQPVEVFEVSY